MAINLFTVLVAENDEDDCIILKGVCDSAALSS